MPYPTIPVEVPFSDIERDLVDNEPPGMFPEDQTSYWGQMRKTFADYMQANALDLFTAWYNNLDPRTVDANDIAEWEYRVGVPGDRSSLSLDQRRAFIQNRLYQGAMTRKQIGRIIESFITPTLVGGSTTAFGAGGIPLTAGGVTLYSGVTGDPKTMYRVYFDYKPHIMYVRVLNTLGEDLPGMTRELTRILPGGWTLNISDVANILWYFRMVMNEAPVWYSPFDANAGDLSGYLDNGTVFGGAGSVAALVNTAADNGGGTALSFDGATQYVTVPHAAQLNVGDHFSVEMWIKPTNFTGNPRLFTKGGAAYEIYLTTGGTLRLQRPSDATVLAHSSINLAAATTYHIVVTKNANGPKIYVNGVDVTVLDTVVTFVNTSNVITIGKLDAVGSNFFTGVIDDVAYYNAALPPATVLAHYNTGLNTP